MNRQDAKSAKNRQDDLCVPLPNIRPRGSTLGGPWRSRLLGGFLFVCLASLAPAADPPPPAEGVIRVATYNVAMYRDRAGQLREELETGKSEQAEKIAEVIQRVRPDVLLLNEFDYDTGRGRSGRLLPTIFLADYLGEPQQSGLAPIVYDHRFYEPVNTGVDSALDLNHDGKPGGPDDAWGYGRYPGQYGMLLLSRFPRHNRFTYRRLRWCEAFTDPTWPTDPQTGEHYYTKVERGLLRLPSKSFWDARIVLPVDQSTRVLHLLCSHPTPPVFDGPEDRNGCRNYDEIRLLAKYINERGRHPLPDDSYEGHGGISAGAPFVVLGDLNADPQDGSGRPGAIQQLLEHPSINATTTPRSDGGRIASEQNPELNRSHKGDPANDTSDFGADGHGNLRIDYVLPSKELKVVGSGVYWPKPGEPGAEAVKASDHRLVWIDIEVLPGQQEASVPGSISEIDVE